MSVQRANIPIQRLNCLKCAAGLKDKLSQIKGISYNEVQYNTSMESFNCECINNVSELENLLTFLGFNPAGEKIKSKVYEGYFCKDSSNNYCINRCK